MTRPSNATRRIQPNPVNIENANKPRVRRISSEAKVSRIEWSWALDKAHKLTIGYRYGASCSLPFPR
jgi:hypothetical protein